MSKLPFSTLKKIKILIYIYIYIYLKLVAKGIDLMKQLKFFLLLFFLHLLEVTRLWVVENKNGFTVLAVDLCESDYLLFTASQFSKLWKKLCSLQS